MAGETNFKFTKALFYKEDVEATIPSNPLAVQTAGVINFSLKDAQQTETNPTLDNAGQASKKDRGKSNYDGNIECKFMGDMMPILATHVLGAPATISATTAEAWATATAYTKYDPFSETLAANQIIAHSNGTNMLVCYTAGTSGASEPTITTEEVGDIITDGTVEWILVENLQDYDGASEACIPSCGIEFTATSGCGAVPVAFKKRFEGVYLNSLELNKSSGGVIHKYSIPVIAAKASDDYTDPDFASIEDEVGYTVQTMTDFAFKYDEMKVLVDGVEPVDATMFRMTIGRNTSYEDGVAVNTKVSNTPIMTVDGELKLKFTREEYAKCFNNESAVVKILLGNARGEQAQFVFNNVERDRVDADFTTERFAEITIPLTADGNNTTKTVDYLIRSQINYQ